MAMLSPHADQRLAVFRYRPTQPVPFVEVYGDMVHWRRGQEMQPIGDGWLETTFRVGVGTYSYKFRLSNNEWVLDPDNPRTRGCDGTCNSPLVVGGADEPILHAPARPYLFIEEDGRLCVRAGVRRGHAETLALR